MADGIPARLTVAEGRRFGLTVGLAFLALAGLAWWRGRVLTCAVLASLGGALIVGGVLLPAQLRPVYRGWMGLAHVMSKMTTPLCLGIVVYLVLTPVGLFPAAAAGIDVEELLAGAVHMDERSKAAPPATDPAPPGPCSRSWWASANAGWPSAHRRSWPRRGSGRRGRDGPRERVELRASERQHRRREVASDDIAACADEGQQYPSASTGYLEHARALSPRQVDVQVELR